MCQLFAEGKQDLCSLSSLIIQLRVLHVCLELKQGTSKSITLAGLPFYTFCSVLPTLPPGTSCLDHCRALRSCLKHFQPKWPKAATVRISEDFLGDHHTGSLCIMWSNMDLTLHVILTTTLRQKRGCSMDSSQRHGLRIRQKESEF